MANNKEENNSIKLNDIKSTSNANQHTTEITNARHDMSIVTIKENCCQGYCKDFCKVFILCMLCACCWNRH